MLRIEKGGRMLKVKKGDIFYADLSPVVGSEQGGVRPVVIIQNDIGNKYSPTTIVAAITSQMNKSRMPTHVQASRYTDLPKNSVVLLEQIRTIDKRRLREKIGHFDHEMMFSIDRSLLISVGLPKDLLENPREKVPPKNIYAPENDTINVYRKGDISSTVNEEKEKIQINPRYKKASMVQGEIEKKERVKPSEQIERMEARKVLERYQEKSKSDS